MMHVWMPYKSQLSLYVRCVSGLAVRDPELVELLHRLEDITDRETNLDTPLDVLCAVSTYFHTLSSFIQNKLQLYLNYINRPSIYAWT